MCACKFLTVCLARFSFNPLLLPVPIEDLLVCFISTRCMKNHDVCVDHREYIYHISYIKRLVNWFGWIQVTGDLI